MAIGKSTLFNGLSGKLANVVVYQVGDQTRIRSNTGTYKDCKSPEQMAQRNKVKVIAGLYHELDLQLLTYWKQLTTGTSLSGYNLFMKENIRQITDEGSIADFSSFKICKGILPAPAPVTMTISLEKKIILDWEGESINSDGRKFDCLQIAVYKPSEETNQKIEIIESTNVHRNEGHYEFQLSPSIKTPAHLYVFFKALYTNDVSDSYYLGVAKHNI